MTRSYFSSLSLPAVLVLGALSGCGGGGDSKPAPLSLSLSGRSANDLSISLTQQSASISSGQGTRYTLTVKNDTSRTRRTELVNHAEGDSPGYFFVSNAAGEDVYDSADFAKDTLSQVDLEPNQGVRRTFVVPASAFAQPGTYRVRAYYLNGFADGAADELGPLEVRVR